jgi:hypothetical protein
MTLDEIENGLNTIYKLKELSNYFDRRITSGLPTDVVPVILTKEQLAILIALIDDFTELRR